MTEDFNAFPHRDGVQPGPQWEQVSLMAAIPSGEYAEWQHEATKGLLKEFEPAESTRKLTAKQIDKLKAARAQAVAPYPPDLLSCLTKDTAWWKQHGWSQPPGSQRVLYWRRAGSLEVGVPELTKSREAQCRSRPCCCRSRPRAAIDPRYRPAPARSARRSCFIVPSLVA